MTIIAAQIAMYVVVDSALVGGLTAWVGEGETGCIAVGERAGVTGVAVGEEVGLTTGAGAKPVSETAKSIPAALL